MKISRSFIPARPSSPTPDAASRGDGVWFPANEVTVQALRKELEKGTEGARLLPLLKNDLSLYGATLMHLREREGRGGAFDPLPRLKAVAREDLLKLLDTAPSLTPHRLRDADRVQVNALRGALIGSAAAELLTEGTTIDPELAFLAACFRQTGGLILAWNYSRLYHKALNIARSEKTDFNEELKQLTGRSPASFGAAIAKEWRFPAALAGALQEEGASAAGNQAGELHLEAIGRIAELVGALSTAAPERIAFLERAIEKESAAFPTLPEPFDLLREVKRYVDDRGYLNDLEAALTGPDGGTSEPARAEAARAQKGGQRTVSGRDGASVLLSVFLETYRGEVKAGKGNAGEFLAKKIFPATGFRLGVLYMTDPKAASLQPLLQFGSGGALVDASERMTARLLLEGARREASTRLSLRGVTGEPVSCLVTEVVDDGETALLYLEHAKGSTTDPAAQEQYYKIVAAFLRESLGWALPEGTERGEASSAESELK